MTFNLEQINIVIEKLKLEGEDYVTSMSVLAKNIKLYVDTSSSQLQVYNQLISYQNLFKKNNINIISNKEYNTIVRQKYILEILATYKDDTKKDYITFQTLHELLDKQYQFKLRDNSSEYQKYKLHEHMKTIGVVFKSTKYSKNKTFEIFKEFANSKIVKKYKKEDKKFTIPEINIILDKKISIATIYTYSNELVGLGIPLRQNKVLDSAKRYTEQEIINKLCLYILDKKIYKIYAGQLAKNSPNVNVPRLSSKKILEYKNYIFKTYQIKVLDANDYQANNIKLNSNLEENNKFLKIKRLKNFKFVDSLPLFHNDDDNDFLVLKDVEKDLESLWMEFLQIYIENLSKNRINVRQELQDEEQKLRMDTENKKVFFLFHNDLHIKNLTIGNIIALSKKKILSRDKLYGIHRQNMFIGFLIFLYSKGLLMISFHEIYTDYYLAKKAQSEIALLLKNNWFYEKYQVLIQENRLTAKEIKMQRLFYFFLLNLNIKISIENISDNLFYDLDKSNKQIALYLKNIFIKLGAQLKIVVAKTQFTQDYYHYMKNDRFKDLILICNNFMNKKVKLRQTKTPESYYRNTSLKLIRFFEFMEQYHKGLKLDKQNLQNIFDYPESNIYTYQEYTDSLSINDATKSSRLTIFVEIFANTKGYEGICTKEKIPSYNLSSKSSREAIEDDEIIHKIDDIVTNRPPASNYFRNYKVDMDLSWWKHLDRVRPFEPLIIKTHLRIPVRGDSIRKIDRDKLLQFDHYGEIKGFYFVSDKNKNRRDPFIVPNIWESELDFLLYLVEYNRKYFPNLKRFYPDDTTLKDGIMLLFPNAEGTANYSESQHQFYWKKVLIQAQMEFQNEGKKYNLVVCNEVELPTTIEEFDKLTVYEINTFEKRYDLHSLRHTGISRYIRAGMPLELVRLLSGHSGFNTILIVYNHVNHKELIDNWLKMKHIDITAEINMHEFSQLFIKKEIFSNDIESINSKEILIILEKYNFFNLQNRTLAFKDGVTMETISKQDPKFWKPILGGICTKQRCPDEILRRCSLCPYFITNYLFIEDIGLNMQLSMARVKKYSDIVIMNRNSQKNEDNVKLRQQMKLEIEDLTGWLEILALAKNSYIENKTNNTISAKSSDMDILQSESIYTILPSLNIEHGYLETLSQAFSKKITDNETVVDLTNQIANKLIRFHAKNNTYHEVEHLENEAIVRSFLSKYEQYSKDWYFNPESQKQLEYLLNQISHQNQPLEHKHENTLLTK